jgi:tartrate dehydratase alpha subunit/fumarate hydratase class I-like protein
VLKKENQKSCPPVLMEEVGIGGTKKCSTIKKKKLKENHADIRKKKREVK